MKVLGINSSANRKGNTAAVMDKVMDAVKKSGAETETINLNDYTINFCNGCSLCLKTGNCHLKDDFEELKRKVESADGLVLASPTYAGTINAQMKKFLERFGMFEYLTTNSFRGKYVIGISTCGGSRAKKTAAELVSYVKNGNFERGYVTGVFPVIMNGKTVNEYPEIDIKAAKIGKKLVNDIEKQNKYILQNISGRIINKYFVQPGLKKMILKKKDSELTGIYQNLYERGLV